jgi:hypothetical protein
VAAPEVRSRKRRRRDSLMRSVPEANDSARMLPAVKGFWQHCIPANTARLI